MAKRGKTVKYNKLAKEFETKYSTRFWFSKKVEQLYSVISFKPFGRFQRNFYASLFVFFTYR